MVGRTPEYLGKKIEAREMKIAAVGALFVPTMVLTLTAIAVSVDAGLKSIFNTGAHGFTEALYAYDSQANNNGSAFAGYGALHFSAQLGTVALYLGRFVPLIAALAIGGALAGKKTVPASAGTFRTDGTHLRRPPRGRDRADRRTHDLPGPHPGADRRRTDELMRDLVRSVIAIVVLTAVFGLAYPLVMTGFAAVAFPDQAGGSLIHRNGKVVGSNLAAQAFTSPRYFHARPSATAPPTTPGRRRSRTSGRQVANGQERAWQRPQS